MCRTDRRKQRRGVTLIEIVLVTAMLSVVAVTSYSVFNSGVKVWQRLTRRIPSEYLNICFEKMSADLRNSFDFSGIKFAGKQDSIRFATLVATRIEEEEVLTIGEVGYCFDVQTGTLNRHQADYSQVYQKKSVDARQIMSNIKSFNFQYYYYDCEGEAYIWKDDWEEQEGEEKERKIPLAVRIKIEFGNDNDTEGEKATRTIAIPAGG